MNIANVFDNAFLYNFFQQSVSRNGTQELINSKILGSDALSRVIDFGCGVGHHSKLFQNGYYLGIDPSESCIRVAERMYASPSIEFKLGDQTTLKSLPGESFDLVFAIGVLHHIDDQVSTEFISETFRLLKPGGRLMTFDPVLHENQSKLSSWIVKQDRGRWVRTEFQQIKIIEKVFSGKIHSQVYKNLLRIQYDHILINTRKVLPS